MILRISQRGRALRGLALAILVVPLAACDPAAQLQTGLDPDVPRYPSLERYITRPQDAAPVADRLTEEWPSGQANVSRDIAQCYAAAGVLAQRHNGAPAHYRFCLALDGLAYRAALSQKLLHRTPTTPYLANSVSSLRWDDMGLRAGLNDREVRFMQGLVSTETQPLMPPGILLTDAVLFPPKSNGCPQVFIKHWWDIQADCDVVLVPRVPSRPLVPNRV